MGTKKVLFITQEIAPYMPETEMSVVSRYLPQYMQEKGLEIRTFMPKWSTINERRNQLHEVIRLSGMNLIIDDTDHPLLIKVASIAQAHVQVYFIDNDDFFQKRKTTVDKDGNPYEDNDERAIFYARGILETVKKLRWMPDIVHCIGWMSAFVPMYIKKSYFDEPSFRNCKVVYSLYEDILQGTFKGDIAKKMSFKGIDANEVNAIIGTPSTYADLHRLAMSYSDGIVQSSAHIDDNLVDYARQLGKPFMNYTEKESVAEAIKQFYDNAL